MEKVDNSCMDSDSDYKYKTKTSNSQGIHYIKNKYTFVHLIITLIGAFILWFVMFLGPFPFWPMMVFSTSVLILFYIIFQGNPFTAFKWNKRTGAVGLFSAIFLYGIFWGGNVLVTAIFQSASEQIDSIYTFKTNVAPLFVAVTLLFPIGFGEEIFWRGFVQRKLSHRFGCSAGIFTTAFLYSIIHIFSGNWVLCLAALMCGIYWGILYSTYQDISVVIISHIVWDILVFSLFPF